MFHSLYFFSVSAHYLTESYEGLHKCCRSTADGFIATINTDRQYSFTSNEQHFLRVHFLKWLPLTFTFEECGTEENGRNFLSSLPTALSFTSSHCLCHIFFSLLYLIYSFFLSAFLFCSLSVILFSLFIFYLHCSSVLFFSLLSLHYSFFTCFYHHDLTYFRFSYIFFKDILGCSPFFVCKRFLNFFVRFNV